MERASIPYFTPQVISNFRDLQDKEHIQRTVTGKYEPVIFPPGSSVRLWVNQENDTYETHWHPSTEIIVPIENTYTIRIQQEEYVLQPGEIFIIPSGELHECVRPDFGIRLIFLFDMAVLQSIKGFPYLISTFSKPVLITPQNPVYHSEMKLLYQIFCDYYSQSSLRELMIFSKLTNFYVEYKENQRALTSPTPKQHQKDIMDRLNIIFFYISQHYTEDIPLEKAAEIAGFSKYHFSRIFKEFSGQNYFDYLSHLRVQTAERMLLVPGSSITDIAYQSGFGSLCAFNRAFKKKNQCTPSEYRNKHSSI